MLEQVFHVATEFKFEVGAAIAESNALQGAVGQLSGAADNALLSFQKLGIGIAAQFGLGTGGLVGMIYKGIQASDKFYQSQLKIANILESNQMFTGPTAFDDSMASARASMEHMQKISRQFSLPVGVFSDLATTLGGVLTRGGLDDSQLTKSTDLTRAFLKSAPVLGVDPGMYQGNLIDMVAGHASIQDRMTQRLTNETQAMKPFSGMGGMQKFNALTPAARLDVLTKALDQFSSNAKVTGAIALSMSGQLRRLNDNLTSMFSIFKPIGNALMEPIKMALFQLNSYLENQGQAIIKNISVVVKSVFGDIEGLYVNLKQLSNLKKDVRHAGEALSIMETTLFIFGFFGITATGIMGKIGMAFRTLIEYMSPWIWPTITGAFRLLSFVVRTFIPPLLAMVFLFQVISRGLAIAQVNNAKWLAENLPKLTELMGRLAFAFRLIFLPVELAIGAIGDFLGWLFDLHITGNLLLGGLEGLIQILEFLGKVVVHALALIAGAIGALIGQVFNIMQGNFKALFSKGEWSKMADEGYNDFWNRYMKKNGDDDENNISKRVTNIGTVQIMNQFKEQMEPDRIAFTMVDVLNKVATNPKQAIGRSLRGAAIGG